MENFEKKFLLGVNPEEKTIYFGELAITDRNGYKELTASFDVGQAFNVEDLDLEEMCQEQWECLDNQSKLDLLYDGDRTREEVFEDWTRYADYNEFRDCSCTDCEVTLESDELVNFETISCGQCDIRENEDEYKNIVFTNEKAVTMLLNLWDSYHLKNIEQDIEEIENKINFILSKLNKYTERKNIEDFIIENIKEL